MRIDIHLRTGEQQRIGTVREVVENMEEEERWRYFLKVFTFMGAIDIYMCGFALWL